MPDKRYVIVQTSSDEDRQQLARDIAELLPSRVHKAWPAELSERVGGYVQDGQTVDNRKGSDGGG